MLNSILENKINQITNDNDKIKESFLKLLNLYLTPAFGSISKRDFEIALFIELKELGIIDDDIYNIISTLRITKSKAQTLLYEAKLRTSNDEKLENELKTLLLTKIYEVDKENKKVLFEITNPYLVDFLKNKLKNLGYLTDTSFNQDILKIDIKAYTNLILEYDFPQKKEILNKLQQQGGIKDVRKRVTKEILTKIAGETLSEIITNFLFKGEE